MDYNATLNLPKTDFPMRAGLPKREPEMLESWYNLDIYHKITEKNQGRPRFVLHDGPPFSNGYIHMGTAMNKCLKDFIVRYKNMSGYDAPYVPGWDNHGMPIESAIIKQAGLDFKKMSVPDFRDACRDFAWKYVNIQRDQFKRLGVLGEWDKPYLTMLPEFEAEEVKVFGQMFEKGYIYKGKKPVYWCPHDETALAEAEIEYSDDACESIYVKFQVTDDKGRLSGHCPLEKLYFVIWTTTTWTIPGNLAICLGPQINYALAKTPSGEVYIVAKELLEDVANACGIESYEIIAELPGSEFEFMKAVHPLYDRQSIVILGEHVTLEAGTGCVHTAPGHGHEDYEICRRYDSSGKTEIGIIVPVDDRGHMTAEAGEQFEGIYYEKANKEIAEELRKRGALIASKKLNHQYAHCWRCKQPILYRATDQWFCSVDAFKEDAVKACGDVRWLPEWGYDRIVSMVRERADWCISRQRNWGLPIPVFYCDSCKKPICTPETIDSVSRAFAEEGSNAWFSLDAEKLLPSGFVCPFCGGEHFTKETDTLDGWFDSGSSHVASMEKDDPTMWPADMYLEGADQYRGWFQSSLLTAVACKGTAPFRIVLSHGWTVDGEGKAMHKSIGNCVLPDDLIPKYGADVLRLWAASSDYRMDVRASEKIFNQLSETYLKIRNTARYILGNLSGFNPDEPIAYEDMLPVDRWALTRLEELKEKCLKGFEVFEFHTAVHAIHNFCVVDMSNFYLDILKDRLYCEARDSFARRSGQTAIYLILDSIVRLIAPVLAFTSNEIWLAMPHSKSEDERHVMLNDMPEIYPDRKLDSETEKYWDRLHALRNDVNKALEISRSEKIIGKPLDAEVTLYVAANAEQEFLHIADADFSTMFIVSKVNVIFGEGEGYEGEEFPGVTVSVSAASSPKCVRCWTHSEDIGESDDHPELCPRCVSAIKA